jgi:uncharacterized protein VirK/YbjX
LALYRVPRLWKWLSNMRATRDDVIECYRAFLQREPESDRAIEHHLKSGLTIIDIAKNLTSSSEYQTNFLYRNNASINKCFEGAYLANNIMLDKRIMAFLYHYTMLLSMIKIDNFRDIMHNYLTILRLDNDILCTVEINAPNVIVNEGELSLIFKVEGQNIYELSFTFVPSAFLYPGSPPAALISRLQGAVGVKEQSRHATKAMGGLNPQSVLLACLVGIADASGVNVIAGIHAVHHICYSEKLDEVFRQSYDENFRTMGFTCTKGPFFIADLPLQTKPLVTISITHRRRAKKRRAAKSHIVAQAKQTWENWSKSVDFEPAPPAAFALPARPRVVSPTNIFSSTVVRLGNIFRNLIC